MSHHFSSRTTQRRAVLQLQQAGREGGREGCRPYTPPLTHTVTAAAVIPVTCVCVIHYNASYVQNTLIWLISLDSSIIAEATYP